MYIYIYTHIYRFICIYIYIYTYISQDDDAAQVRSRNKVRRRRILLKHTARRARLGAVVRHPSPQLTHELHILRLLRRRA